jgi:hypothetical protein
MEAYERLQETAVEAKAYFDHRTSTTTKFAEDIYKEVDAIAHICFLGYTWTQAKYLYEQKKINAEAIESHGLHKTKDTVKSLNRYPEAMAFLRNPHMRRVQTVPDETLDYWPLYEGLKEELGSDAAGAIASELALADLGPPAAPATINCYRIMTETQGARPLEAAKWLATLVKNDVDPGTYVLAIQGEPEALDVVLPLLPEVLAYQEDRRPKRKQYEAFDEGEFRDEHLTYGVDATVGGALNKLDLVVYDFGMERTDTGHRKVVGGKFSGYFKPSKKYDTDFATHRGTASGIGHKDPNFEGRALALYALDQFLGADVIPPTFRAQHKGVEGTVMQEIEGKTRGKTATTKLAEVEVKRGLSTLYLLDYIAGQNDRHSENVIISPDGKVWGIDNDLAFGERYTHARPHTTTRGGAAGIMVGELDVIDQAFAERIIAKAADPRLAELMQEALGGLISDAEIKATIVRLRTLARALEQVAQDPKALQRLSKWDSVENANKQDARFI